MEQGRMNVPKLVLVTLIYILLSTLGFFTEIITVLFPVFALPFALYVVKNKPPVMLQVIFHMIMLVINYLIFDFNIAAALIYSVGVIAPAYILLFFYREKLPLPNFIMYAGISFCVICFVFLTMMKLMGIDLEQIYMNLLEQLKMIFKEATATLIRLQPKGSSESGQYIEALNERQKYVVEALDAMKAFYAYTVVTLVMSFTALSVVIFNSILRRRDKQLPSIRQLIEFRLSKTAVLIFVIAMFVVSMAGAEQNALIVLGLNLMNVFIWLFRIAGGLGLIGLLNRSTVNGGLKVLGYIGIVLSFGIFPYILMIFGCLDAFFNYRKVEIVV